MNTKLLISILCFIFAYTVITAQEGGLQTSGKLSKGGNIEFKDIDKEVTRAVDNFFTKVIKDDLKNGFDELLKNSVIALKRDDVENLRKQTERSMEIYGKILSFEFVNAERVTDSYLRVRYIGLHSNYPMRWVFTFYRSPDKGWIITNVKFDDMSEYFFTD